MKLIKQLYFFTVLLVLVNSTNANPFGKLIEAAENASKGAKEAIQQKTDSPKNSTADTNKSAPLHDKSQGPTSTSASGDGKTDEPISLQKFTPNMPKSEVQQILAASSKPGGSCRVVENAIESEGYVFGDTNIICRRLLTFFDISVGEATFHFIKDKLGSVAYENIGGPDRYAHTESSQSSSTYPPIVNALNDKFKSKPFEINEAAQFAKDRGLRGYIWINRKTNDQFDYEARFAPKRGGGVEFSGIAISMSTGEWRSIVNARTKEREDRKISKQKQSEEKRKKDI